MQAVMKTFGCLVLILAGISANAQNPHEIKVNVPFAFTAAGKDLPPGEYDLFLNPLKTVVTLRGENSTALFLMSASSNLTQDERSFVRFYSDGEHYTLQDVSFVGVEQRVVSAHVNKLLTAEPAASDKKKVGAVTTPSLVILTAEGREN